jgi:hypothetical protein
MLVAYSILFLRAPDSAYAHRTKRSFALAEVCVAIIVIGSCISYVFSSLQQTIQRYTILRQEIACHECADEHLAKLIATFLTSPPDFDTAIEGGESSIIERIYEIHMTTMACENSKEENEPEKEMKKKAALVTITVTVRPIGNDQISATRTTNLCIGQEGTL